MWQRKLLLLLLLLLVKKFTYLLQYMLRSASCGDKEEAILSFILKRNNQLILTIFQIYNQAQGDVPRSSNFHQNAWYQHDNLQSNNPVGPMAGGMCLCIDSYGQESNLLRN